VELAEKLAARFGTRNNGEEMTQARRNKYVMQEEIRKKGVRAVTQKLARTEEEVKVFCAELAAISKGGPFKCVVKPNESAGTDSVFLCNSPTEVGDRQQSNSLAYESLVLESL
jgi:glutathione synthase/RimK-type ligase-like ATP-grasp enzyme